MKNVIRLSASVGKGQANRPEDVRTLQDLLCRYQAKNNALKNVKVDGVFGPNTEKAVINFQKHIFKHSKPDGIVSTGQITIQQLSLQSTNNGSCDQIVSIGGIKNATFVDISKKLGCETAAIKAIVATEVGIRGAYDSQGRPTILFERHIFSKLTGGKYDKSHPVISNPIQGGYGYFSAQYTKLNEAEKLNREAALKSASWGVFQILGLNFKQAGFKNVRDFVKAMKISLVEQANAFVEYISNDARLLAALHQKNWSKFAKIYNGSAYRVNNYDGKMKNNYNKILYSK